MSPVTLAQLDFAAKHWIQVVPVVPRRVPAIEEVEARVRAFRERLIVVQALIELLRVRVSQINGCAYCIDQHVADARTAGVDERRLTLLSVWRDTRIYSDRERAALAWAESLTHVASGGPSDAIWEQVSECFLPSQVVDLTLVVTTINAWNRFAVGFRKLPV